MESNAANSVDYLHRQYRIWNPLEKILTTLCNYTKTKIFTFNDPALLYIAITGTPVNPPYLECWCAASVSYLFVGDPEGKGPGTHAQPAGDKALVQCPEPFITNRLQEAVRGISIQKTPEKEDRIK